MPSGDIYQHWLNATPTVAFPFSFQDKKVGKIQQTWADVRSGIQKDSISTAMPFCTSHITPSTMQCNLIGDAIRREERMVKRWATEKEESSKQRSSASRLEPINGSPSFADQQTLSRLSNSSSAMSFRSSAMTQEERDLLTNTDGGRGRLAYLKHRRSMSPTERFGRPRTMQQLYGWNYDGPQQQQANGRGSAFSSTSAA